MAVLGTAWNPLTWTCSLTQEVTSAPFQETNSGAKVQALLTQPLPKVTLSAQEGLNYGSPTTASRAQPSCSALQMRQAAGPTAAGQARIAAAKQPGDQAVPSCLQAQRERSVHCCCLSTAALPSSAHSRALPAHRPHLWHNRPCTNTVLASVSWGHGPLYSPQ